MIRPSTWRKYTLTPLEGSFKIPCDAMAPGPRFAGYRVLIEGTEEECYPENNRKETRMLPAAQLANT